MWYNVSMSDMEIINTNLPPEQGITKRMVADAIRSEGIVETSYYPDGNKRLTYVTILARMIWQATVEGEVSFADGTIMKITDDPKFWLDAVKFLATHLDGPAGNTTNFTGINVFKVYRGIDPDRV